MAAVDGGTGASPGRPTGRPTGGPGGDESAGGRHREALMAATLTCASRVGAAAISLEEVAAEAGRSRATLYRVFPGGRDQLLRETVTWEVARFWAAVAREMAPFTSLEDKLSAGVLAASARLREHALLRRLLEEEPEEVVPLLEESEDLVYVVIRDALVDLLEREDPSRLRPGLDLERAAGYIATLALSWIAAPGRWDLSDPAVVRDLVTRQLLAGIVV